MSAHLALVVEHEPWEPRAACIDKDPDLFFPEGGRNSDRFAKAICAICPVRAECLEFAISKGIEHGIWGGTNQAQRRRMIRERRREVGESNRRGPDLLKPCGTTAAYRRHLRRGEPACAECLQANYVQTAEYEERQRA